MRKNFLKYARFRSYFPDVSTLAKLFIRVLSCEIFFIDSSMLVTMLKTTKV